MKVLFEVLINSNDANGTQEDHDSATTVEDRGNDEETRSRDDTQGISVGAKTGRIA